MIEDKDDLIKRLRKEIFALRQRLQLASTVVQYAKNVTSDGNRTYLSTSSLRRAIKEYEKHVTDQVVEQRQQKELFQEVTD